MAPILASQLTLCERHATSSHLDASHLTPSDADSCDPAHSNCVHVGPGVDLCECHAGYETADEGTPTGSQLTPA